MNKQKGHEGDVERLIEEHQPQLKAFIHRRVSSKEDAEDILQDVFYQLVKAVSNTLNPIYVNGKLLAEHFGGYLPVSVDVTDAHAQS